MRRLLLAPLATALLLTGCGGGDSTPTSTEGLTPVQAIGQVAAKTQEAGSAKMSLTTTVDAGGEALTFGGEGAFALDGNKGQLSLELPGGMGSVEIRIVDGTAYLKVPGQPGWLSTPLEKLAGSTFGSSSDPTSSLEQLASSSSDLAEDGTETVRGAKTTRYTGTLDYEKAAAAASGVSKKQLEKSLEALTSKDVPFTAWIDEEGRMRKFEQKLELEQGGEKGSAEVTLEFFDFGTDVDVTAPPAAEVTKDSPLLDQLLAA